MDVLTGCAALLCLLLCCVLLRQVKPEYAPLLCCAGVVLLASRLLAEWVHRLAELSALADLYGLDSTLTLLCKALGAATCAALTADLCRDCGQTSLASRAELLGKLAILALTVPVVVSLLSAL